jgi:hypothetical protein
MRNDLPSSKPGEAQKDGDIGLEETELSLSAYVGGGPSMSREREEMSRATSNKSGDIISDGLGMQKAVSGWTERSISMGKSLELR